MTVLTNSFEGGTNGAALTPLVSGNTGGASGNFFDAITATAASGAVDVFDNTHVAHGTMACKIATGINSVQSLNRWSTSIGAVPQVWFRTYLYFTAIPSALFRFIGFANSSGSNTCATVAISPTGKVEFFNATGSAVITTANAIPLNAWFRVEGLLIGSATVGQMQLKTFTTAMDGQVPDEMLTSTAVQNTFGPPGLYSFGQVSNQANVAPFWMDDIGLSTTGYLGPYGTPTNTTGSGFISFMA